MTQLWAAPADPLRSPCPDPVPPDAAVPGPSMGSARPRPLRAGLLGSRKGATHPARRQTGPGPGPFMFRPLEPNSNLEPLKGMGRAPARSGPAATGTAPSPKARWCRWKGKLSQPSQNPARPRTPSPNSLAALHRDGVGKCHGFRAPRCHSQPAGLLCCLELLPGVEQRSFSSFPAADQEELRLRTSWSSLRDGAVG